MSLAAVVAASCGQQPEKQSEKQVSVTAKGNGSSTSDIFVKEVDSFYIEYEEAKEHVKAWKNFVNKYNLPTAFNSSSAFVIPTSTIRYIMDSNHQDYLVFYLGMDTATDSLMLVFEGGNQETTQMGEVIHFTPVKVENNIRYAFNNTWPCPICPINGLLDGGYNVPFDSVHFSKKR
jgi:hypothetical protein